MSNSLKIESATLDDVATIAAIEEESWVSTYPNSEFGIRLDDVQARFADKKKRLQLIAADLEASGHSFWLARANNELVGYLHLLFEESFNDLIEIYLLPSAQGRGYGKLLLEFALRKFGNTKPVQLEVAIYNTIAQSLYKKFGFEEKPEITQPPEEDWNVLPSGIIIPVVFMVRDAR